jgi:outer membrane lipoprotein-sorting protein
MKNPIKLFLILIVGSIPHVEAQEQRAKALLDEVSESLAQFDNISISFTYELVNRKELIQQKEKGSLIMEGDAYLLELMGIKQLSDGTNKHTINPDNEEVLIESLSDDFDEGLSPSKIFSFYKQGYRFEWDIAQPLYGGRKIQYIKLIPIDTYAQAAYLLLGIDTRTKRIYKLIEIGNDGTETTLTISSFETNIQIPKNTFVFSVSDYPNYYIDKF